MSNIYRDPKRKVSEPTEADFARGVASSMDVKSGTVSFLAGLAASFLLGKVSQRGRR